MMTFMKILGDISNSVPPAQLPSCPHLSLRPWWFGTCNWTLVEFQNDNSEGFLGFCSGADLPVQDTHPVDVGQGPMTPSSRCWRRAAVTSDQLASSSSSSSSSSTEACADGWTVIQDTASLSLYRPGVSLLYSQLLCTADALITCVRERIISHQCNFRYEN